MPRSDLVNRAGLRPGVSQPVREASPSTIETMMQILLAFGAVLVLDLGIVVLCAWAEAGRGR